MATEAKTGISKFDKLPIIVQLLAGLGLLAIIAAVGFAALFAIDILLLDFDPIGRLVASIASFFS